MTAARGRVIVFSLLTAAYFLSYFYRSTNAVIAPDLTRELELTAGDLGLMTGFFYAAFAAVQIPIGIALDRYGPRVVQPVLLCVAVLGSLVFAVADSLPTLILARALLGLGLGASLMAAFKAFSLWFPLGRNATYTGLLTAIGALGGPLASTPLAILAERLGWRSPFWIGAIVTLVCAGAIALWVRNTPSGVTWPQPPKAVNPLEALRDPRIWRISGLNFFAVGVFLSVQTLWGGPFLYDAYGLEKIAVGNALVVMGFGVAVGYLLTGWLGDRFGASRVAVWAALGGIACQLALVIRVPFALIVPAYFLLGAFGTGNLLLLAHARSIFPPQMTGRVTTTVNMFGIGGSFVLQWVIGLIVGAFPKVADHAPPVAYSVAFGVMLTCTVLMLWAYLPLARGEQAGEK